MYKNKMISFAAGVFMLTPLVASAQTDTLQALQQQIAALQQQLANLNRQSRSGHSQALPTEKPKPTIETIVPIVSEGDEGDTPPVITFDRDLYLGLRNDSDVSNLQEFLTDQGFYNNTISGNFFILTRNAVKKFQQAHGIKPSGYFGSLTRTVANKILTGEEVLPTTPPPFPVSLGHLNIDPAYAVLKIGETQRIRAIFTPPRPACLDANPSCKMPERAPYEVQALFTSDNPKVAMVDEAVSTCPVPVSGIQSSCPDPLHFVRGVSEGGAVITATLYTDTTERAHTARMKVSVSGGAVSQNLAPVISGLKGPTALKVNEAGTWTIQAHDPENGSLAYHITWDDEEIGIPRASQAPSAAERINQTATFTHTYTKTGTFTPLFVVVDEGNLSAKTSASVAVGGGTSGMFFIADVSGVQSTYLPGQQIKLTVKGVESDGSPATSGEGFNVQTYIYDAARTKTYAGVNGTYNASTGYWDVLLDAPSASNVSYDLEVFLYCSNDSAVCTSKYGRAAQVTKLFKFTLAQSVPTDLRITSITRETFHPYGFNMTICTDGSQSINDLKKTIPNLTSFPTDYVVYDLQGNRHRGDASSGGSTEDMKNGQCQTLGWTIQQSEQAYYDQTKKVELFLDPANLIAETNESNNSLVFAEVQQQPSITVLSPNGGEQYQAGQSAQMPLKWSASCAISAFTIELYKSGNFVQMINSNVPAGICSGSQQSTPYYTTWQIPSTLSAGSDYKARVSKNASNNFSTVFDDSDAPFSIAQP